MQADNTNILYTGKHVKFNGRQLVIQSIDSNKSKTVTTITAKDTATGRVHMITTPAASIKTTN